MTQQIYNSLYDYYKIRKNEFSYIAFGGAIVFPGGSLTPLGNAVHHSFSNDERQKLYEIGKNDLSIREWSFHNDIPDIGDLKSRLEHKPLAFPAKVLDAINNSNNKILGSFEIATGLGMYYAGYKFAGKIQVQSSYMAFQNGRTAFEMFITGGLLTAYGITRLAGVNDNTFSTEFTGILKPLVA